MGPSPRLSPVVYKYSGKLQNYKMHVHFAKEVSVLVFQDFPGETRKAYWEIFARDRMRFRDRIQQVEPLINTVLAKKCLQIKNITESFL